MSNACPKCGSTEVARVGCAGCCLQCNCQWVVAGTLLSAPYAIGHVVGAVTIIEDRNDKKLGHCVRFDLACACVCADKMNARKKN